MSFLRRLSPNTIPPAVLKQGGLQVQRERIIQALLIIFCGFGLPTLVSAASGAIAEGKMALPFVYGAIYLLFLIMLAARGLPYGLRAALIAAVAYLLAVTELFESGQLGEVRMFLIAFVALVSVLFHYRYAIGAILLGLLTILCVGILASVLPTTVFPSLAHINDGTNWVTSMITYLMLATMIAGSIAMIISGLERNLNEQAQAVRALEAERNLLDQRVKERTQTMLVRLNHVRTAADISRAISALSDQDILLHQVADTLKDRFSLYYVGVFLIDEVRQYAQLKAGTGEAGKQMVADGHRLAIGGSSMIGWAISNRMARIALDVGSEAVRFNNPRLPLTRSEMALPIIAHDEVLGALTIQSEKANAFDEDDITILEGVADSLAIALENAQLYQETRQNLDEIRALNRDYLQRAWAETTRAYGDLDYAFENRPGTISEALAQGKASHEVLIPLTLRGEVIGEIALEIDREVLSADEESFVENISTQTAIALENARLLQETERKAYQEQKLNEMSTRFARAMNIDEILRTAVQELGQLPAVSEVSVHLNPVDPDATRVHVPRQMPAKMNGKEHTQ
jgi:GAF domain-containing protein